MKNDSFEDYLATEHAEQYIGTKDCMVDDFADWLDDLTFDEWFMYGDLFAARKVRQSIEQLGKKLERIGDDKRHRQTHAV